MDLSTSTIWPRTPSCHQFIVVVVAIVAVVVVVVVVVAVVVVVSDGCILVRPAFDVVVCDKFSTITRMYAHGTSIIVPCDMSMNYVTSKQVIMCKYL